jgi:hypothetical protein
MTVQATHSDQARGPDSPPAMPTRIMYNPTGILPESDSPVSLRVPPRRRGGAKQSRLIRGMPFRDGIASSSRFRQDSSQ